MRRTLEVLTSGLAAALLLLTLAGYAGDLGPAFETLTNFRLHLAVLAGFLAVALGLARSWYSAGFSLLTVLIATAGLGPVFELPERPGSQIPGDSRPLSLLYANLREMNPQPKAIAAMLRATDADILITSETSRAVADGPGGLRNAYPYHLVHSGPGNTLRTAIWSRYPLHGGALYLNNTIAPTGAAAIVDLGGGTSVGLIGAHFSRPFERLHRVQTEALGPMAGKLTQPVIVAGDFNAAPWSATVARAAEVTGTRIIGGHRITWRGTYPTPFGELPALWGQQIDHILLSDEIGVDTVETLPLPGSDHLALFVRLRIAPQ